MVALVAFDHRTYAVLHQEIQHPVVSLQDLVVHSLLLACHIGEVPEQNFLNILNYKNHSFVKLTYNNKVVRNHYQKLVMLDWSILMVLVAQNVEDSSPQPSFHQAQDQAPFPAGLVLLMETETFLWF